MPYTFSHIGYILPLKKKYTRYLSSTGLAFGSIAPDYDILFRVTENRYHIFQYDAASILLFIYPLALLSALGFHFFCRNILIRQLPDVFQKENSHLLSFNFLSFLRRHFLKISLSILLAILLHLFLDFLCHCLEAYTVKMHVLKLTDNLLAADISYISAIYLLPVLFTIAGFYLLYLHLLKGQLQLKDLCLSREKTAFWTLLSCCTLLISGIKLWYTNIQHSFFIDYILISLTSSLIISVYLVCGIYSFTNHFRKNEIN